MTEGRVDDQLIEIGDPTEEPLALEAPPQVVIQYHERGGVPWMLIPPLLLLSAIGAILLYHKLAPRPNPVRVLVKATEIPGEGIDGREQVAPPLVEVPVVEAPAVAGSSPSPAEPVAPASIPVAPIESVAEPVKAPEPDPVPFPRVQGLGFDPKALEAERKGDAPADPALAAAVRAIVPDDRDQPREVDPDLLPPDPRLARARQQQRRLDALKKVEEERSRFHAELKDICLKFREESGPEIYDLQKKYGSRIEPSAEKKAAQLLGKNGKFVGADRRTRIELLRSLGYPESVILGDLFDHHGVKLIGERDGPRSQGEALYSSALFLLRNPPTQDANHSRTVSEPRSGPTTRATPAPSVFGNAAGPAR